MKVNLHIQRLCVPKFVKKEAKNIEKYKLLLDNLINFGACVFKDKDLPMDFTTYLQKWVLLNPEIVARVHDRWARQDVREVMSEREEED